MKTPGLIFFFTALFSQSFSQRAIGSFPISVCCNKTSNIIFSYAIRSVDRGSRFLLVQKARGADNILQLKAGRENFDTTNLSVITSDGRFFSFLVSYAPDPVAMNFTFSADSSGQNTEGFENNTNDALLGHDSQVILRQKHFLRYQVYGEGLKFWLCSIYLKDHLLWFSFDIRNLSFLDYRPDYLRCFIQDKTKAARTALQEKEIPLLYPQKTFPVVAGKQNKEFVLGFAPFSFSRDKKMMVQVSEANGGRSLLLSIPYKAILKAVPLNDK